MKNKIYLDDIRDPKTDHNLVVVRTVEDFKNHILTNGINNVDEISFDHDLGDDVPSGYDAAKWLVDYMLDNMIMQEVKYNVHSANPVGAANNRGLLDHFNRYVSSETK